MSNTIDMTELLRNRHEATLRRREAELAKLNEVVGFMREACVQALKDCCHKGSIQARHLQMAIDKAGEL